MLHKYYLSGVSSNYNLKFRSNTAGDGEWTIPYVCSSLRSILDKGTKEDFKLNTVLSGYRQFLYLEKSNKTKRYWKVVIGVWDNRLKYIQGNNPDRIIRVTVDDFETLVRSKKTDEYFEELPVYIYNTYYGRMFY